MTHHLIRFIRQLTAAAIVLSTMMLTASAARGGPTGTPGDTIRRVKSESASGQSQAVIVNGVPLAHTAQLMGTSADGRLVGGDDVAAQTRQVLANVTAALASAGSSRGRIAKLNVYVARDDIAPRVRQVLQESFSEAAPAVCYVTTRLPIADALVAMDVVAACDAPTSAPSFVAKRVDGLVGHPQQTHVAVLPLGSRIYVAGQAEKGDLREATRKTLESLQATLKFLGRTDADVVQLKSFVTPMARVAEVEDEFRKFFGQRPVPPLVFVEWESSLPIEIELVAAGGSSPGHVDRAEYLTPPGMTTPTIYSRVSRIHGPRTIFISGLYGRADTDGAAQVTEIFSELGKILEQAGGDFQHLSKATYYVSNEDTSKQLNELRPKYYDPRRPPAASKAMVRGVAQPGRGITVDMIAVPAK